MVDRAFGYVRLVLPPVLVPALRPPRFVVELAELRDQNPIPHHEEAARLHVAAIWRLGRGVEDGLQILVADGLIAAQAPDRPLGEHRLADGHVEIGGRIDIGHFHGRGSWRRDDENMHD